MTSRLATAIFLVVALAAGPASAEAIKVGMLKTSGSGLVHIAKEKGYFDAEGLTAELFFFDAALPLTTGVVTGDIDFGVTGIGAAFYNLAGQGQMRLIASQAREVPNYPNNTVVASNRAWGAGLKSYKDLAGHVVGIGSVGTPPQYCFALLAEKYRFDLKSLTFLSLQSTPNSVSAVIGNKVDASVIPVTYIMPAIDRGDAKLLGFCGDEMSWQLGGAFISTKTADNKRDTVERFLRAYRKGAKDYHDAFTGPGEIRQDGPTAPEILAIIAKYTGQPADLIKLGISYVDADVRLDLADIKKQIAWYKSQGMVKPEIDGEGLVDMRYAKLLQ
jgi:NitT/TauT family transport system substrate-binding protein